MKRVLPVLICIIAAFITFSYNTQDVHGWRSGAPSGRTGSPGDGANCTGCHNTNAAISGSANAEITSTIPATGYIPGQTYTVTATVSGNGLVRFGFEISPQNVSGAQRGTIVVTDPTNTQITGVKYITHTTLGTNGTNSRTWNFNWTAPVAGTGAFSFYGAFNAANNNNQSSGDIIYLEQLAVVEAAQINTQPQNATVCAGATASFTVAATGTNITYQWKKNGTTLTNDGHFQGVTSPVLQILNTTVADVDSYTCEVTGSGNTVVSNSVTLSLATPASISANPAPLTLCAGQTAVFNVTATGTNITYQWKRNNVNVTNGGTISGATSNQLTITGVTAGNAGTYTCQVSNSCATPTSAGALLTVNPVTAITTQPVSQTLCSGGTLNLSVVADGLGLTYQWKKGVTPVGTNSPNFSLSNITTADAGTYTCEVTGTCGNATSNSAVISVNPITTITQQPSPQTICQGSNTFLTVAADGANLNYQWKRGNTNVGTNSPTLNLNNAQVADGGSYTCVVTGACGTVTSNAVTVTVNPTTVVTTQPLTQSACNGTPVTFSVVANGIGLGYQWKKDGNIIQNATSAAYTINSITGADAGNYTCEITGGCGNATSNIAALTVLNSAAISQQPQAQSVCPGAPLTLTVTGSGGNNTMYQWRRNTNNINGANGSTYTVPAAGVNDVGSYDVIITGSCGTVTSNAVSVSLLETTSVNNIFNPVAICAGSNQTFTVSAQGENLTYQWFRNDTAIDNETSAVLQLTNLTLADTGTYTVEVTGDCGVVTASISSLQLLFPPQITGISLPLPICVGSSISFSVQASGGNLNYQWFKNGQLIQGANSPGYNEDFPVDGDSVTCSIWNTCDSISSATFYVDVLPELVATISQVGSSTLSTGVYAAYQWYLEGNLLNGQGSQTLNTNFISGNYTVVVTDNNGCVDTSDAFFYFPENIAENQASLISIYPNPGNGDVHFTTPANFGKFTVKVISATGQLVTDKVVENNYLNIADMPPGIYSVLVVTDKFTGRYRLVKE